MIEGCIEGQPLLRLEIEKQLGRCSDHIMLPVAAAGLSSGIYSYFQDYMVD